MSSITVKVKPDSDPMSPRGEFENMGHMACWHRSYNLGDEQPKEDPQEWLKENAPEGSVVLGLYLFDHSGISISSGEFSCGWDSGWVGCIVVNPTRIKAEYGDTSEASLAKVRKVLEAEVKIYDNYLTGDVWGYVIEKSVDCDACHHSESEEIDSCWGFYGDALDQMKDHVDSEHHEALKKAWDDR